MALKNMKDSNCTILRGALYFSSLRLGFSSPKQFAFFNRLIKV